MNFNSVYAAGALVTLSLCLLPAHAQKADPKLQSCVLIHTAAELQAINNNKNGSYCLANDIDASSIANFTPIGDFSNAFTGRFFGNNHVIRNLSVSSSGNYVGPFGFASDAVIQDVGMVNVKATATTGAQTLGGLVGTALGSSIISRVYVTGKVSCPVVACNVGGIVGYTNGSAAVADSWSSASVSGVDGDVGGAVGQIFNSTTSVTRVYASGSVTCSGACHGGGLAGLNQGTIQLSYATGSVTGTANFVLLGGLVGYQSAGIVQQSFATGPVTVGVGASAGGLVGKQQDGSVTESYAAGPVTVGSGSNAGGVLGFASGTPTFANNYWDTATSGVLTDAAGSTGKTTAQLRAALPAGFSNNWAISKNLSYPFLNASQIDFASPLATSVLSNKLYVYLPLSQLDKSLYGGTTNHLDQASLGIVYTMIGRAVGQAQNIATLKTVKPNKYFNDKTQATKLKAPLTDHLTLGTLTDIAANKALVKSNVIRPLDQGKLVILRGSFTKTGGGTQVHYMLATMYTKDDVNKLSTVVANDPWTGWQIEIDPVSKTVLTPHFPLNFKVDGFQTATIN